MKLSDYLLFSVLIFFSSCATVFNKNTSDSYIYVTSPAKLVINRDTLTTRNNGTKITALRKNRPISITIVNDGSKQIFEIAPINSLAYYANIMYTFGVGMLVDRNKDRRYGYPKYIYIDPSDSLGRYYKYPKFGKSKNDVFLHLGIPYVNSLTLHPDGGKRKSMTGFLGLSLGLDYYHQKDQFLNFTAAILTTFQAPVPAPIKRDGESETLSSIFVSFSNNIHINVFYLGYGLSYSRNIWNFLDSGNDNSPLPINSSIRKSSDAIGLLFSSHYKLTESFNVGLIYRPSLFRPTLSPTLKYEHLISLDFAWKIRLYTKTKSYYK